MLAVHWIFKLLEVLQAYSMPEIKGGFTADYHKLQSFIASVSESKLAVGFLGTESYDSGVKVGRVARVHEFGFLKKNIPPRPYMRPAIDEITANAVSLVGNLIPSAIEGGLSIEDIYEDLGTYSVSEVRKSIERVFNPPLKAPTLAARQRRGNFSDKPLEDTGKMKDSVAHEVTSNA